jgi:ribosome-associated protein
VTAATLDQVRGWCQVAARAAASKLGSDTVILGMTDLVSITDAFVVTSGSNPRQVRTIAEEVERAVKVADGPSPLRVEGLNDARWVLMDYGDFVVHIFSEEARQFYDLERLWADAAVWVWADEAAVAAGE